MSFRRIPVVILTGVAVALGLGACGGGDDSGAGQASTPGTATTSPPTTGGSPATPAPAPEERRSFDVTGGTTAFEFPAAVASVLSAAGIELRPVAPARQGDGGVIELPITAGRFTAGSPAGEIRHTGGIEIAVAGQSARATDLVLQPGRDVVTAEVAGRRVPLFAAGFGRAAVTDDAVRFEDVDARLSPEVVAQLDERLGGGGVLRAGLPLGQLDVRAERG